MSNIFVFKLKYILVITFLNDGILYQLDRGEGENRRVKIAYDGKNAKRDRDEKLKELDRSNIEINGNFFNKTSNEGKMTISSREMMRLIEELTINSNKLYGINKIKYGEKYLLRSILEVISNIRNDDKRIFQLLSICILSTPDEMIFNPDRDIFANIFVLENIFFQYFCVGSEDKQGVKITYDELQKLFRIR